MTSKNKHKNAVETLAVIMVSDPMSAWAWGMANTLDNIRSALADSLEFRLELAGSNCSGIAPVAEDALSSFQEHWSRVAVVTGQEFGQRLPARQDFVFNNLAACCALQLAREASGDEPFALLRDMQQAFFVAGQDITDAQVLAGLAAKLGHEQASFQMKLAERLAAAAAGDQVSVGVTAQANSAPAILVEGRKGRQLFASGYNSAEWLIPDLRDWARNQNAGS